MDSMINAKEKACPIPVILAKKEADRGNKDFTLLVDNKTAVENLIRFGENNGFIITVDEKGPDDFSVRFVRSSELGHFHRKRRHWARRPGAGRILNEDVLIHPGARRRHS